MRRLGPQDYSGIVTFAVAAAVGLPVAVGAAETLIPRIWWIAVFILFLCCLLAAGVVYVGSRPGHAALAGAVAASWVAVLTAPGVGLLPVILVVTVAVSAYAAPIWAGLVLTGLNTAVLAVSLGASGSQPPGLPAILAFYLLIQLASHLSSASIIAGERMRRELAETNVALRASQLLLAQSVRTAERLRISRELHDLIGHQLTVLTLELETAQHTEGAGARPHVKRANRVARELLSDVRTTVGELRTETADLHAMLAEVVQDLPGLTVQVEVEPGLHPDEEQAAALLRAVQEIATNTLRHSGASTLGVKVSRDGADIVLEAVDNGRGGMPQPGNGLRGLRERFEALGGSVGLDGSCGFRLTARVPAS
ncbi:sensor histidine kinase [Arthrobacter caoxuetaonis]|uniref:Histidine kinase n=1 Tax=Arthrobacter caoxuetaonis TaxID=2886935 RepID=A0A9X1SE12_9MICC|nr:histidine kinase [Arthrobacter caoxuetaonis]MCC3299186.1 histidine kinase [Arthrobacter caoxuetaonis]USQ58490.1 histidine kinase [Arthrobacter caoxuetaonis]